MRKIFTLLFLVVISLSAKATVHTIVATTGNTFNPNVLTVQVGDTVRWVWQNGAAAHDLQSLTVPSGAATFGNPTPIPLDMSNPIFEYKVTKQGGYGYRCTIHTSPSMAGAFQANPAASVPNQLLENTTTVAPNPANSTLVINTKMENASLYLYDIIGKLVTQTSGTKTSGGYTMDVSAIPAGNYTLIMKADDAVLTRRITIAR